LARDEFDVIVVGAGAAGIAAARRLQGSGLHALVLEARARPGGRAFTTTLDGHVVDLGCGWLHSAETNPWVEIARRRGFTIDKSPPPWARADAQIGPNRADMADFGAAIGRFRARVEDYPQDGPDAALDALVAPGEPMRPMIDAVSTYYSGAEPEKISTIDLARYADSGVNWRVREGLGAAIAAEAEGLPIRYEAQVRRIDRRGARLAVETGEGGLATRAAIVTLPSAILAQTPDFFAPALPEKTEAAARLPLGLADKLYLELTAPEDFPADSRAFGRTDTRATAAYHFRPLGKPLIEAFFGGELADELERGGAAAVEDFVLGELAGLFGAEFRSRVRALPFHGWRTDPLARGAYSYAKLGSADARATLAASVEDRIFFAGEACSKHGYSTAHGAYETGVAAAEAALVALGAQ
jgi:monoamine oxidase